ncbi:MAG: ComEA family DNA-binding protein [Patescibacteria group bacterium]
MDENSSHDGIMGFFKRNALSVVLGIVGLICLVYGVMQILPQKPDKPDILFEAASDTAPAVKKANSTVKTKEITIDVSGAVLKPGVYKLSAESRIQDALIAAGGLAVQADREQVAKDINLAAKLTDGAKLYIPFVGEQTTTTEKSAASSESTQSSIININTASSSELEALPGIGEVTAGKIIDGRPYTTIEELVEKKAVGKSVFEKIKELITI